MPFFTLQPAFANGEVSPELQRRTDLERYRTGVKTLRNFIVNSTGGISNRPPTMFIHATKDSSKKSILIPFVQGTTQAYVIEFGNLYCRFYDNNGIIESEGTPVEIESPYTENQLNGLNYTQSADILYITSPYHQPRMLIRYSDTDWELVMYRPINGPYMMSNTTETTISPSATTGDITLTASEDIFNSNHVNVWWRIGAPVSGVYGNVKITAVTDGKHANATVMNTLSSALATINWAEGSWSNYRGWPTSVIFYQDRLIFASTKTEPEAVWSSQSGDYINFARSSPLVDSDGITNNLPSRQVNKVNNLVSLGDIIALTSATEWKIGPSSEDGLFTPTTAKTKCQGYRGSSIVTPIIIGERIIYVQGMGSVVRDLGYDNAKGGYAGSNLSLVAKHLLTGHTVKAMAYQQEPESIVWIIRDDGALLGMTYNVESGVLAWHHHDTKGGIFESLCNIPGNGYDEVWFIVKRGSNRYVEKLIQRTISTDPADQVYLDCHLSYDVSKDISGVMNNNPVVITATSHGFSDGDLIDISDIVWQPIIDQFGNETQPDQLNKYRYIVANKTTHSFELQDEYGNNVDGTAFKAYASGGKVRKCVTTISGLDHLEGLSVGILSNGDVLPEQTVEDGAITLGVPTSRIHIGLPYISDIETLNVDFPTGQGTIQSRPVSIPKVTFMFHNSRGGYFGNNFTNMVEIINRNAEPMGTPTELATWDYTETIPSGWKKGARVCYRQKDPLPVTILGIIPEVQLGG